MKQRTLIMHRSYFGIEALRLREGSARAASRIVGLPAERARVNVQHLWHDFGVNPVAGKALIEEFVAQGMLQPREGKPDDFFLRPDAIADTFFHLAGQDRSAWSSEVDVRPFAEKW